jgi:lipoyl(octanoyl) transferase
VKAKPADCLGVWLGRIGYPDALQLQTRISEAKKRGFPYDVLLLLEHPPTITLGRNAKDQNVLVERQELQRRGIGCFEVDRGGDVTFHGPGQLVGYPILALAGDERDIRRLMYRIEESMLRVLRAYGIEGGRDPSHPGVWTAQGKIGAIGIHVSRWITTHGFALNVNTNLDYFKLIIPCGIVGKSVVSMDTLLGRSLEVQQVAEDYAREFAVVFERNVVPGSLADLQGELQEF